MSVLIYGAESIIFKVGHFLFHYDELIERGALPAEVKSLRPCTSEAWSMKNKYYHADLNLNFHPSLREMADPHDFEGVILVYSEEEKDSVLSMGDKLAEADLPLKLLVTFKNESSADAADEDRHLLWAIDRGFEWIDIRESELTKDHDQRDKTGLPRLVEAMHSTMWSTLRKISDKKPSENTDKPSKPAESVVSSKPDEVKPSDEDSDEDELEFEHFAAMMAQARSLRDDAITGKLTDEQRRRNAADFAMKISQMLNLGEEADDDL